MWVIKLLKAFNSFKARDIVSNEHTKRNCVSEEIFIDVLKGRSNFKRSRNIYTKTAVTFDEEKFESINLLQSPTGLYLQRISRQLAYQ